MTFAIEIIRWFGANTCCIEWNHLKVQQRNNGQIRNCIAFRNWKGKYLWLSFRNVQFSSKNFTQIESDIRINNSWLFYFSMQYEPKFHTSRNRLAVIALNITVYSSVIHLSWGFVDVFFFFSLASLFTSIWFELNRTDEINMLLRIFFNICEPLCITLFYTFLIFEPQTTALVMTLTWQVNRCRDCVFRLHSFQSSTYGTIFQMKFRLTKWHLREIGIERARTSKSEKAKEN